jgi:hypothetical protein
MPGGLSLELTPRAIMRSFPARRRGPRFRSSRSRLMNQQANNAEETRFGAFLKASQTLAERERQRFHGLGLTIL